MLNVPASNLLVFLATSSAASGAILQIKISTKSEKSVAIPNAENIWLKWCRNSPKTSRSTFQCISKPDSDWVRLRFWLAEKQWIAIWEFRTTTKRAHLEGKSVGGYLCLPSLPPKIKMVLWTLFMIAHRSQPLIEQPHFFGMYCRTTASFFSVPSKNSCSIANKATELCKWKYFSLSLGHLVLFLGSSNVKNLTISGMV